MVPNRLARIDLHFDPKEAAGGTAVLKPLGVVDEAGKQTRGAVR